MISLGDSNFCKNLLGSIVIVTIPGKHCANLGAGRGHAVQYAEGIAGISGAAVIVLGGSAIVGINHSYGVGHAGGYSHGSILKSQTALATGGFKTIYQTGLVDSYTVAELVVLLYISDADNAVYVIFRQAAILQRILECLYSQCVWISDIMQVSLPIVLSIVHIADTYDRHSP